MAVGEWGPLVVVGGFGVGFLVLWIGSKLEKPSPARRAVFWAGGLLVAGTVLFWLLVGVGLVGTLIILGVLVALPFAVILIGQLLGARRRRKAGPDANPAPIWPAFVALPFAVGFCFWWLLWSVNPALHLLDLSHQVDFHVTSGRSANYDPDLVAGDDGLETFNGTYELDGRTFTVEGSWALGAAVPTTGTTIRAGVGPVWPYNVFEDTESASMMLTLGTLLGLPTTIGFTYLTLRWFGVGRKTENQVS